MSSRVGGRTGSAGKKVDLLNKRIPENPRYKHVKSTIDTGASLSKYLEHLEEIRRNYRYRKDEIFKRIKVTTFAQLVLQVAASEEVESVVETPPPTRGSPTPTPPSHPQPSSESPPDTARSTLSSVVAGVGEMDLRWSEGASPTRSPPPPPSSTCPYLLLDIRDREDYDHCHIITAKSYPATMLSRSCNYFTREILEYRNKPGRIIILYDEDERIAPQAATTFVERGVDNVFMLSGGLKVQCKAFPVGFLSGPAPPSCLQSPPGSAHRKSTASRGQRLPGTPVASAQLPVAHRDKFTGEGLEFIQQKLDELLLATVPSSRASSRSSTSGGTSRTASRTDSRATPWK